jgi:hypothetical protein
LKAYLQVPGFIRHVYRLARLIVTKNSHIIMVGLPRMCGRELLQLATLVYPGTILHEPEVKMSRDIIAFKKDFKAALLLTIRSNENVMFLYDTNHTDDPVYVDYLANYIRLFDKDSIEMFDKEF